MGSDATVFAVAEQQSQGTRSEIADEELTNFVNPLLAEVTDEWDQSEQNANT